MPPPTHSTLDIRPLLSLLPFFIFNEKMELIVMKKEKCEANGSGAGCLYIYLCITCMHTLLAYSAFSVLCDGAAGRE